MNDVMSIEKNQTTIDIENFNPPTTRFQGSKRKIIPWIYDKIHELEFETVLDGFAGTGTVSYLFKLMNKTVTFNDIMKSNTNTGISYISNNKITLSKKDLDFFVL